MSTYVRQPEHTFVSCPFDCGWREIQWKNAGESVSHQSRAEKALEDHKSYCEKNPANKEKVLFITQKGPVLLLALIIACLFSFLVPAISKAFFLWRAYSPFPTDYIGRLHMLQGWGTDIGTGLNCSGFISNAHGSQFRKSSDFYSNAFGDLELLGELAAYSQIDESKLRVGDLAAFEGPANAPRIGIHVAAYLGGGVWTDADVRRGNIGTWKLSEKEQNDAFFSGHVRLYRWKPDGQISLMAGVSTIGQDNKNP